MDSHRHPDKPVFLFVSKSDTASFDHWFFKYRFKPVKPLLTGTIYILTSEENIPESFKEAKSRSKRTSRNLMKPMIPMIPRKVMSKRSPAMDVSRFLNHLAQYSGENTFNPWADHDENYEIEKALAIRRANLKDYLTLRIGGARILLVAEACGYQGGHFSGIAMTCERMLLDFHPAVTSAMVLGHKETAPAGRTVPFKAYPAGKRVQ